MRCTGWGEIFSHRLQARVWRGDEKVFTNIVSALQSNLVEWQLEKLSLPSLKIMVIGLSGGEFSISTVRHEGPLTKNFLDLSL